MVKSLTRKNPFFIIRKDDRKDKENEGKEALKQPMRFKRPVFLCKTGLKQGAKTKAKSKRRSHLMFIISKGIYICSICNKEYRAKESLRYHINNHNKSKRKKKIVFKTKAIKDKVNTNNRIGHESLMYKVIKMKRLNRFKIYKAASVPKDKGKATVKEDNSKVQNKTLFHLTRRE